MMMLKQIIGEDKIIRFVLSNTAREITIQAFSPAVREHILLGELTTSAENHQISIPRYAFGRDGLFLAYELHEKGRKITGIRYVNQFRMTPQYTYNYPVVETKKGLQINPAMIDDAIELGVRHCALNVSMGELMCLPSAGQITFHYDGSDYCFSKQAVEQCDQRIRKMSEAGILVTLILLCTQSWPLEPPDKMIAPLLHPDYVNDQKNGGGWISGFNVMSDLGVRYYAAFIAFLIQRYTNPTQAQGRALGLIISNEVNSHWIWCNSGEKRLAEIAEEYATCLRLACQVAAQIYPSTRIYASMDHFWTGSYAPQQPERYVGARSFLKQMNHYGKRTGDFPWNLAFHPYPENLKEPDFWNDQTATHQEDTIRVTFNNLEILRDFLYLPENCYNGQPRHIILSEQGFNSKWTVESEVLQAYAYGLAYKKVMQIPEIDSFIYHSHCDNKGEGGDLNLGLWRRKRIGTGFDAPKPIYYVFKTIDQMDETGHYHWEKY